jgi:hypothetical protein
MEGICRRDFVKVAVTVKIHIQRLRYGRLQRVFAAHSVQSAPGFNLVVVNGVYLFASQEVRF